MSGRAFLPLVALTLAALSAGCKDDSSNAPVSTCMTLGPDVEILDNHLPSGGDHRLVIPATDVVAGVERTYDIRGDNVGHTHFVTVTEPDFASLQRGDPVSLTSTNNGPVGIGHVHGINLSCP
jgi:hypothetical protein